MKILCSRMKAGIILLIIALLMSGCSGPDAESSFEKAEKYTNVNNYPAAIIELKNTLKVDPKHFAARKLIASIYFQTGDFRSAEKEARRTLELGKDPETEVLLSKSLFVMNRFDELKERISNQEFTDPKLNTETKVLNARLHLRKGEIEEAGRILQMLEQGRVENSGLLVALADYYLLSNDVQKARQYIEQATLKYPDLRKPWLMLGRIMVQQGDYSEGLEAFERALNVEAKGEDIPLLLDALYGKTVAQIRLNQLDDALQGLNVHIERYGDVPQLMYLKGLAFFQKQEFEQSFEVLREVAQVQPNFYPALLLLGTVEYRLGRLEQARNHIRTYVAKVPDDMAGKRMLGELELQLNSPEKAFEVLKPLSEKTNNADSSLLSLVGESALQSGSLELGVEYFKKAVELQPDNANAQLQYALALMRAGEIVQAMQILQSMKASEQAPFRREALLLQSYNATGKEQAFESLLADMNVRLPRDPQAQKFLGDVYLARQKPDKAEEYYQKALALDSKYIEAMIGVAQVRAIQGRLPEALEISSSALRLNPDEEAVVLYHVRLLELAHGYKKAIEKLKEYILFHEESSQSIWYLVQLATQNRDREEIESLIDYLVEHKKADERYLNLAIRLALDIDQVDRANRLFTQLQSSYENKISFLTTAVNLHLKSNRTELAREHLQQLIALDPANIQGLTLAARLEAANGNYNKAAEYLEDVGEEGRNAPQYLLFAGKVSEELKQYQRAAEQYRHGLEISGAMPFLAGMYRLARLMPNSDYELQADTWVLQNGKDNPAVKLVQAEHLAAQGKYKEAVVFYEELLTDERAQEDASILNNYAWNLFYSGMREKSLEVAKKAYGMSNQNPYIGDTLGWIMVHDKAKLQEGIELLKKSFAAANGHPEVAYHLAYGLNATGDHAGAKKILEKTLTVEDDFTSRQEASLLYENLQQR